MILDLFKLDGKVAVVTGANTGLGQGMAVALAEAGAKVVGVGRRSCAETKEKIEAFGGSFTEVLADLSTTAAVDTVLSGALDVYGRVDILVNNAGVAPKERKDLLEMSEESFDRVLGINTKGTMFLTQLAAKQMIKQEQIFKSKGHIVNVGSCSAEVSSTSRGEYCVSKAAVSMLTTLFADRLAPEGILVNEVRPGVIATDMTSVVTEKYDTMIKNGVFPIARWGKAEDVAEMIAFFCSDSVLYTTGNYVDVDGGFHIKRL